MSSFKRVASDRQLFNDGHLSDVLRGWSQKLNEAVQGIEAAKLLESDPSHWAEHMASRFRREPPRLRPEGVIVSDPEDADIDAMHSVHFGSRLNGRPLIVKGTRVTFHVPFDGDGELLRYLPSSYFDRPMRASIGRGELNFGYLMLQGTDPKQVKQEFDHELGLIVQVAGNVAREVEGWNQTLPSQARALVDRRREKLLADHALVDAFGLPVRRRPGAATTFAVPLSRRQIVPPSPPSVTAPAAPDPAMDAKVYDEILGVCRTMSLVMERSPSAFAGMGEEHLRVHFLVALNAQFEGAATGETFNCEGKTDILVRYRDRNIFIAECKFWTGPDSLRGAIDQVLSYLAWRDTKAAILLFNRNKDFSLVVEQIPAVVRGHAAYVRDASEGKDAEFRAVLRRPDDAGRELHLAVLAFDVPRA